MRRTFFIAILLILGLLPSAESALAHAGVVSTSPAQDEVLTVMPSEIQIIFSEELITIADQEINTISLTHFDGPPIEITDVNVSGATLTAKVAPGEYESGIYEVSYRIVSADGHKVSDSWTFSLNAPAITSAPSLDEDGDGVLPLPIVAAIAIMVILGGYLAFRTRNRKN